jgi:hypothetical protein
MYASLTTNSYTSGVGHGAKVCGNQFNFRQAKGRLSCLQCIFFGAYVSDHGSDRKTRDRAKPLSERGEHFSPFFLTKVMIDECIILKRHDNLSRDRRD